MQEKLTIGLDLSAGDCTSVFPKVLESLQQNTNLNINFFIPQNVQINKKNLPSHIVITHCKDFIDSGLDPVTAYRKLQYSPIHTAFKALDTQDIDILFTNGPTGLITLLTKKNFSSLSLYKQPTLSTIVNVNNKPCMILDIGAAPTATEKNLIDFTKIGLQCVPILGISNPRVGLLNIGSEPYKGRSEHIKANKSLTTLQEDKTLPFTFIGNIESSDIFKNAADLIICDGFSGNILIKTVEALSPYHSIQIDILPGAFLLGSKKLIIKCHASATDKDILKTIKHPLVSKAKQLLEKINH